MKTPSDRVIQAVDWPALCPWLAICKALRLGFSFRLMFFTTLSVLASVIALLWAGGTVSNSAQMLDFLEKFSAVKRPIAIEISEAGIPADVLEAAMNAEGSAAPVPKPSACPFAFQNWQAWGTLALAGMFTVLAFLTFARITAGYVATGVRPYFLKELRFSCSKFPAVWAGLFFWGIGLVAALIPSWGLACLPDACAVWATPLALMFNLFAMFVLLGGVLGLPLLCAALVTENSDCFDALSRSFSYLFQRPLRLGFYLAFAILLGVLGFFVMDFLAKFVVEMFFVLSGRECTPEAGFWVWFWCITFGWIRNTFCVLFGSCACAVIYMLLRRDVDAVEMTDIWFREPQDVPMPQLPKLDGTSEDS